MRHDEADADRVEAFEERSSIFEFEAGMPRDLAEDCARYDATAPVYAEMSDEELQAIIDRPVPEWALAIARRQRGESPEVERINRFLKANPADGNDEFIRWVLSTPYMEPTRYVIPPIDFPEGWQNDPDVWARLVELGGRIRECDRDK